MSSCKITKNSLNHKAHTHNIIDTCVDRFLFEITFLEGSFFATNISSSDNIRSKMKEEVQLSNDP